MLTQVLESEKIQAIQQKLDSNTHNFLGYPVSKDFNYQALTPFLQYPMNNLGDPFIESTYGVDSKELEMEVVEFFAKLFRAPENNWWGYVTNGGSESNLYGLYVARELYGKGMVYHSEATHYSVQKNLHLLNMPSIVIRTQENGEINYEDLKSTIQINRHMPAIIVANIGTTMTEARDDVSKIRKILNDLAIQNSYIHADAALSGGYSGFLEPRPPFDFQDGVDSISLSGHKFIGSPIPSGVVVVKKQNRDRIARSIEYIGSLDTTITGSRNGHSPLFLWYAIKKYGVEELKQRALHSLDTAAYTEHALKAMGIAAWRNPQTITVVFPKPHPKVCEKWQLAAEGDLAHIICMPNVTREQIDEFIQDMKRYMD